MTDWDSSWRRRRKRRQTVEQVEQVSLSTLPRKHPDPLLSARPVTLSCRKLKAGETMARRMLQSDLASTSPRTFAGKTDLGLLHLSSMFCVCYYMHPFIYTKSYQINIFTCDVGKFDQIDQPWKQAGIFSAAPGSLQLLRVVRLPYRKFDGVLRSC